MNVTSLPAVVDDQMRMGTALAGDDYSIEQIEVWLAQEREAYFAHDTDGEMSETDPWYDYMRHVNEQMIFRDIISGETECRRLLVIGPGPGDEVADLAARRPDIELTFVEASENFQNFLQQRFPGSEVRAPALDGSIDVDTGTFDVVLALSVLHHVANVSNVLAEVSRILAPSGHFFVREPCSSMGDWRYPRPTTPNERGIAKNFMIGACRSSGLALQKKPVPILFEPLNKLILKKFPRVPVNHTLFFFLDWIVSRMVAVNDHYWRDTMIKKIGPSSYQYHFKKTG